MLEKSLQIFLKLAQAVFLFFLAIIIYSAIPHGWRDMNRLHALLDHIPSSDTYEHTASSLRSEGFLVTMTEAHGHEIVAGSSNGTTGWDLYAESGEHVVFGRKPRIASTFVCSYDMYCAFIFDVHGKLVKRWKMQDRYCL